VQKAERDKGGDFRHRVSSWIEAKIPALSQKPGVSAIPILPILSILPTVLTF
jgi:hypothetical protein